MSRPPPDLTDRQQSVIGQRLHWQLFDTPPGLDADFHEHCLFCTVTIREEPRNARERGSGYTTDDQALWICADCHDAHRRLLRGK